MLRPIASLRSSAKRQTADENIKHNLKLRLGNFYVIISFNFVYKYPLDCSYDLVFETCVCIEIKNRKKHRNLLLIRAVVPYKE